MNATFKTVMLWTSLLVVVFLAWHFAQFQKKETPVKFSEFMAQVEAGQVADVTITGNEIKGHTASREAFRTFAPLGYDKLTDRLLAKSVVVTYQPDTTPTWANMLISWAPFLLLIGFWVFFMRQMQSGGNKALSFGKSKAKLLASQQKKVTFKDVAGVDEAKAELQEIIEFLREPQKFQKLGGRIPKGVLLMGPPGSGKTLLARAISGEANVPFFSISGSDFVEMFVGVGASRVRDLFEQGKKNAPCIIFIDEIDAVGRHRGAGLGGGHDEREQTLNALLVEMDGFETNDGVILIAATNRPDVLDPALLRPGRFDRRVVVSRPDVRGREGILQVHTRKIPLAEDVDLSVLARSTPGFSGADLANLVNEAALMAARNNQKFVSMKDFESSKDKVLMGAERRSLIITDEEKKVTAFHEAGHALLAALVPHSDPLHKVTIIPRGLALGLTQQLPTEERHNWSKEQLEARIAVCMGGRIAEEMTFVADHHRRPERHRAGDRDGPQDDLRVGHERGPRPPHLRQEGGGHLPGQGVQPAPGLLRGHRPQDRRRDQAHRHGPVRARDEAAHRAAAGPRAHRGGAARARGARRAAAEAADRGRAARGDGRPAPAPPRPRARSGPRRAGARRASSRLRWRTRGRRPRGGCGGGDREEGASPLPHPAEGRPRGARRAHARHGHPQRDPRLLLRRRAARRGRTRRSRAACACSRRAPTGWTWAGESTRPGAARVAADEETRRTAPVVEGLRRRGAGPLSIDTTKASVARAALDAGADLVNDVSAFGYDPAMASLVAAARRPRGAHAPARRLRARCTARRPTGT